jgi:hypothetical protein
MRHVAATRHPELPESWRSRCDVQSLVPGKAGRLRGGRHVRHMRLSLITHGEIWRPAAPRGRGGAIRLSARSTRSRPPNRGRRTTNDRQTPTQCNAACSRSGRTRKSPRYPLVTHPYHLVGAKQRPHCASPRGSSLDRPPHVLRRIRPAKRHSHSLHIA